MSTLSFAAERYDALANQYFDYTVLYYKTHHGAETEVIESKSKRRFASRTQTSLKLSDLFVGATVVINSFQLTITQYNDAATEAALSTMHETTLAIVHGEAMQSLGKIITAANGFGFRITKLQTLNVTAATLEVLQSAGLSGISEGTAAFLVLLRPNAVQEWQKLMKRMAGNQAEIYGSESVESARVEIEQVFSSGLTQHTSARCKRTSSLCLIKAHAVGAGHAGAIILALVEAGLAVTAVEQIQLSKADALEFLTCYRGVLPEFSSQVEALYDGPVVAVEVSAEDSVVARLRAVAGPFNVTYAKCLAPQSIRAQFGVNNVDNAVHVTDLETDGQLETNFFFRVLKT